MKTGRNAFLAVLICDFFVGEIDFSAIFGRMGRNGGRSEINSVICRAVNNPLKWLTKSYLNRLSTSFSQRFCGSLPLTGGVKWGDMVQNGLN